MKKILLLLSLCALLTACNAQSDNTQVESETESESTTAKMIEKEIASKELLENLDARQALAMAIDKEFICDVILSNGAKATNNLIPKKLDQHYDEEFMKEITDDSNLSTPFGYHYDLTKAKEHWQKAKSELGFSNVKLTLLSYDSKGGKKIAEFLKESLEKNLEGLTLEITNLDFKKKNEASKTGNYDLELSGWAAEVPSAGNFIQLFKDFQNEEFQNQFKEKSWLKAEHSLLENIALIPLYNRGELYLQKPSISSINEMVFFPSPNFQTAKTDNKNKHIIIATDQDIISLNQSILSDPPSEMIAGAIYEGLTAINSKSQTVLAGAISYEKSDDDLSYHFKIRPEAKFSNGKTITANDYLFAFRRLANLRSAGKNSEVLINAHIKNAAAVIAGEKPVEELGVSVSAEGEFIIELDQPCDYLLRYFALPVFSPINAEFAEEKAHKYGSSPSNILANGAFILADWKKGESFRLEKNISYWNQANVEPNVIEFKIIKDANIALAQIENGKVDRTYLAGKTSKSEGAEISPKAVTYFIRVN